MSGLYDEADDWREEDDDQEPDWDEDGHQQYKDGVAMGYINEDGTYREPDEPDWDRRAEDEHSDQVHGGGPCNCPPEPLADRPDPWTGSGYSYADEPPF